jgi:uncharacterized protein YndB with AHSA1/START domain
MFVTILWIAAAIVVVLLVVIAMQSNELRVARSATIAAPPDTVFAQVNDFRNWEAWNPWGKIDPEIKHTYDGAPSGAGAGYAWVGNNEVGSGRMTIVDSDPHELIRIRLDFEKPMKATSTAEFTFVPEGSGTRVTWSMFGEKNFMSKAIGLVMNMDKMIGGNFEKGLADMKAVAEAASQHSVNDNHE